MRKRHLCEYGQNLARRREQKDKEVDTIAIGSKLISTNRLLCMSW